jgi:polysaccharide export outer membrane protein
MPMPTFLSFCRDAYLRLRGSISRMARSRIAPVPSALLRLLIAPLLFAALTTQSEGAPYRLDSGDVIEVSVFGRDDLNRRMAVDADGNIWVPLIGEVHVTGMAMKDLRTKVRDLLATSDAVRWVDVFVDLVERRPFYIHGSVAKAGAYPYQSKMTVRHAVALAGGLGAGATAAILPTTVVETRGRYEELKGELVRQQIRIAGLQAETGEKTDFEVTGLAPGVASRPDVARLIALEKARLRARIVEREKERQYLSAAIKLTDTRVAALEQGQKVDEEATKLANQEYERVAELSRKGLAPTSRVTDEQQAAVLFKIREQDTAGRLALARQSREELQWRLEKADDRQAAIPQELHDATAALIEAQTKLNAVSEQMALTGAIGAQLGEMQDNAPEIEIFRRDSTGAQVRIVANEDTEIEAGDVIEVKVRLGWLNFVPEN